jgi:ubiquinone/menaquinone biosynthesis C-methylase UbiE
MLDDMRGPAELRIIQNERLHKVHVGAKKTVGSVKAQTALDGPAYVARMLERLPRELTPDELFFHLGHFEGVGGRDFRAAQRRLDELVLSFEWLKRGERVLDVGCGMGGTLHRLAHAGLELSLWGVDASTAQLARARQHLPPEVQLVHADACELPFGAGEFDVVTAIECLFHFPSRQRFLEQAARVLRPGGRLCITDFAPTSELRADAALAGPVLALLHEGLAPWPDPLAREGTLDELATRTGFIKSWEMDATANVLPGFSLLVGERGFSDPSSVVDTSDRGTAALGWLLAQGHFTMRYLHFELAAPLS